MLCSKKVDTMVSMTTTLYSYSSVSFVYTDDLMKKKTLTIDFSKLNGSLLRTTYYYNTTQEDLNIGVGIAITIVRKKKDFNVRTL